MTMAQIIILSIDIALIVGIWGLLSVSIVVAVLENDGKEI